MTIRYLLLYKTNKITLIHYIFVLCGQIGNSLGSNHYRLIVIDSSTIRKMKNIIRCIKMHEGGWSLMIS